MCVKLHAGSAATRGRSHANCAATQRPESGKHVYRALVAQWKAQQASKRPKTAKLLGDNRLREYVQERLAGRVRLADGTIVTGPQVPVWKGLNKPHRQDRKWATAWSPQQISHA